MIMAPGDITQAAACGERAGNTERNALIVQMREDGVGPREIARRLNFAASIVAGVLYRAGMTHRQVAKPRPPWKPRPARAIAPRRSTRQRVDRALIRQLYLDGVTLSQIADRTNLAGNGSVLYYVRDLPRRRVVEGVGKRRDRAFKIMALVAALTGESRAGAARRLGFSVHSYPNWFADAGLVAEAQSMADRIKARWAREAAAAEAIKATELAAEIKRIAEINRPVFDQMPTRHRAMMEMRASGETLEAVGQMFGVTRERIRQIEVKWRLRGFTLADARSLSDAAIKANGSRHRSAQPFDFWTVAHAVGGKRPYTISAEERERRRAHGRRLAAQLWGNRQNAGQST